MRRYLLISAYFARIAGTFSAYNSLESKFAYKQSLGRLESKGCKMHTSMLFGVHIFPTQFSFQPDDFARAAEERGFENVCVLRTYPYTRTLSQCAGAHIRSARVLLANI